MLATHIPLIAFSVGEQEAGVSNAGAQTSEADSSACSKGPKGSPGRDVHQSISKKATQNNVNSISLLCCG